MTFSPRTQLKILRKHPSEADPGRFFPENSTDFHCPNLSFFKPKLWGLNKKIGYFLLNMMHMYLYYLYCFLAGLRGAVVFDDLSPC